FNGPRIGGAKLPFGALVAVETEQFGLAFEVPGRRDQAVPCVIPCTDDAVATVAFGPAVEKPSARAAAAVPEATVYRVADFTVVKIVGEGDGFAPRDDFTQFAGGVPAAAQLAQQVERAVINDVG